MIPAPNCGNCSAPTSGRWTHGCVTDHADSLALALTFTDGIPSNPVTGWAHADDIPAIRVGRDLWNDKGGSLTRAELDEALVRYSAEANGIPIDPISRIQTQVVQQ